VSGSPISRGLTLRANELLRHVGIRLVRRRSPFEAAERRSLLLRHFHIDTVFDVGGATGEYALELREHGYRGRIISCEPLPRSYSKLVAHSETDPLWDAVMKAVGAEAGEATLNIAGNDDSSSFLPMLETHLQAAPHTAYVDTAVVQVTTMRDLLSEAAPFARNVFVKVDTQGFEKAVLDGTPFEEVTGFQLELSLVPLYARAPLYREVIDLFVSKGFELMSVEPGFQHPSTGQLLQMDGIFFRSR
jgi:FkbM family methyltransferase